MVRQPVKTIYFAVVRWLTLPNHLITRLRFRKRLTDEGLYLHLGCGVDYFEGMINIDGNLLRKKDVWLDLRNGLPFPTESAALVYCSHTLEHLYPDDAIGLLREIHRVLRKGGVARIAVPSMEHAMKIARGNGGSEFPRKFDDSVAQAINYLFCDGQHKYGYSSGLMREFAAEAGFGKFFDYSAEHGVTPKEYGPVRLGDEPEGSLVVELTK